MGSDNHPSNPVESVTDSGLPDIKKPPNYKFAVLGTLFGQVGSGILGGIMYVYFV